MGKDDVSELKTMKANCRLCGADKNHFVRAEHEETNDYDDGEWGRSRHSIVQCMGCENLSVVIATTCSYWEDIEYDDRGRPVRRNYPEEIDQFPPQTYRKKPDWSGELPDDIDETLDEVYVAMQNKCLRLASLGSRTVIDLMIVELVGDKGTFRDKLNQLESKGWMGEKNTAFLFSALDAGNASAHRGHSPSVKIMNMVMDILENVLQAAFILGKHGDEIRKNTPPRPPRKNKK